MKKVISFNNDLLPLLKLVIPLVLTGVTQSAGFFIETIFLAHLGQEVLAAGALASWLYATLVVISFGTLSSINVLVANKHGENDEEGISCVFRDGLFLAILVAIPAFVLLWKMSPIFLLFGQHPNLVMLAESYLHALAWGVFPNLLMISFFEFLIGISHARVILIFSLLSVLLNIFFSYIFIFGKFGFPLLGIAGAGWGTTASSFVSVLCLVTYILSKKIYRNYCQNLFYFHGKTYLWELIKIGVPIGTMYCCEVGFFFALTLFMGTLGQVWIAANQVAMQYMGSLMSIIFSIAQAITARMGYLIGKKDSNSAKRTAYMGVTISASFMLIIAIVYVWIPEKLISIDFNIESVTNKEIVRNIKQLFIVAAVFQLFEAIRISLFGALRTPIQK